jgi:uncharacterized protein YbjT (DUF2867 family)
MSKPTILITGATGNIGTELTAQLRQAGANVLAGSTSGKALNGVPGRTVDFKSPETLKAAFHGVDRLFLLFPLVPNKLELAGNAVAAARAAGVKHIVRSSGAGADPASPVAIARLQGEIDQLIIESGIAYTLLRPASFMQNWFVYYGGMIKSGTLYLSHADGKASFIDVRDIAAVAAAVLLDPAPHAGKSYTLTGPAALSASEVLDEIAKAGGPRATYTAVPESTAVESMKKMGMDDWTVGIMSSLNRVIAGGYANGLSEDVQTVIGRAPRSFAEFARDNVNAWR